MRKKDQLVLLAIILLFFASYVSGQNPERNLLTSKYNKEYLANCLENGTGWVSYPSYSDRKAWEALPSDLRNLYISEGEKNLGQEWQTIPPTAYLEFDRSGNRRMQEGYLGRITGPLRSLFLAELMEGKGRFLDQIINGVWALCESSSLCFQTD